MSGHGKRVDEAKLQESYTIISLADFRIFLYTYHKYREVLLSIGKEGNTMLMPEIINDTHFFNQSEAAKFLGITAQTFRAKYDSAENRVLKRYKNPRDEKEVLYKVEDVQKLAAIEPRDD